MGSNTSQQIDQKVETALRDTIQVDELRLLSLGTFLEAITLLRSVPFYGVQG